MAINENDEFGYTVCTICYEKLKPLTEHLQTISICGHVFHELCLQQWLEYCIANNTKCPVCKQTCGRKDITRLYFQSDCDTIQPQDGTPEDEVKKIRGKLLGLTSSYEHQQQKLKDLSEELHRCNQEKNKGTAEYAALEQDCLRYRKKLAVNRLILMDANLNEVIRDRKLRVKSINNSSSKNPVVDRESALKNFWTRLQSDAPQLDSLFRYLMRMFQRGSIFQSELFHEVAILLQHHPDLIDEFNNLGFSHVVVLPIHRG